FERECCPADRHVCQGPDNATCCAADEQCCVRDGVAICIATGACCDDTSCSGECSVCDTTNPYASACDDAVAVCAGNAPGTDVACWSCLSGACIGAVDTSSCSGTGQVCCSQICCAQGDVCAIAPSDGEIGIPVEPFCCTPLTCMDEGFGAEGDPCGSVSDTCFGLIDCGCDSGLYCDTETSTCAPTSDFSVSKVDESNMPLAGACFTLYGGVCPAFGDPVRSEQCVDDVTGQTVFTGLEAGIYCVVESTVPDEYEVTNGGVLTVVIPTDTAGTFVNTRVTTTPAPDCVLPIVPGNPAAIGNACGADDECCGEDSFCCDGYCVVAGSCCPSREADCPECRSCVAGVCRPANDGSRCGGDGGGGSEGGTCCAGQCSPLGCTQCEGDSDCTSLGPCWECGNDDVCVSCDDDDPTSRRHCCSGQCVQKLHRCCEDDDDCGTSYCASDGDTLLTGTSCDTQAGICYFGNNASCSELGCLQCGLNGSGQADCIAGCASGFACCQHPIGYDYCAAGSCPDLCDEEENPCTGPCQICANGECQYCDYFVSDAICCSGVCVFEEACPDPGTTTTDLPSCDPPCGDCYQCLSGQTGPVCEAVANRTDPNGDCAQHGACYTCWDFGEGAYCGFDCTKSDTCCANGCADCAASGGCSIENQSRCAANETCLEDTCVCDIDSYEECEESEVCCPDSTGGVECKTGSTCPDPCQGVTCFGQAICVNGDCECPAPYVINPVTNECSECNGTVENCPVFHPDWDPACTFCDGMTAACQVTNGAPCAGGVCNSTGQCVCQPNCAGKCGGADNGCGGRCPNPCADIGNRSQTCCEDGSGFHCSLNDQMLCNDGICHTCPGTPESCIRNCLVSSGQTICICQ
ncbi:MAG: hypothetical protein IT335_05045, partial [Thermomicrobiales bacterium]|nr:hypothetical protein [Thermomicrobiales bacterium]